MDLKTKSLGLVLSGGGTKGLAHVGVIQFLEEQNIRNKQNQDGRHFQHRL